MKRFFVVPILLCLLLFNGFSNPCEAFYDPDSFWLTGTLVASQLDLDLKFSEKSWNQRRYSNNPRFKKAWPMYTKVKPVIYIAHETDDKLSLQAFIENKNLFLSLSREERKTLVKEVKLILYIVAVGNALGGMKGLDLDEQETKILEHIIVRVWVRGPTTPPFLEGEYGNLHHAGFINNKYVFSVPYYLDLKEKDGKWVMHDEHQILIESE